MSKYSIASMEASKGLVRKLADVYEAGGAKYEIGWLKKRADRVRTCTDVWTGNVCSHCGKVTHFHTFGCGDRLCPICIVRRSRATAAQALKVVPYLSGRPILLTLTQRNVKGDDLDRELTNISDAWKLLCKHRGVQRDMIGWAKTTEITYNSVRRDYHPHVHIIAYISQDNKEMLYDEYWRKKWAEVMRLDYTPIVDVREIDDARGAVYEVSKYVSKVHKLLDLPGDQMIDAITTVAYAIKDRRLRTYGGDWRKIRRDLVLKDAEQMNDEELTAADKELDIEVCCEEPMRPVVMAWSNCNYHEITVKDREDANYAGRGTHDHNNGFRRDSSHVGVGGM